MADEGTSVPVGLMGWHEGAAAVARDRRGDAGVRVAAIADVADVGSRTWLRVFPGARVWPSAADMLASTDVAGVVVATDVDRRASDAEAALLAGKHVLHAEPLCWRPARAESLEALASERGLVLAPLGPRTAHPVIAGVGHRLQEYGAPGGPLRCTAAAPLDPDRLAVEGLLEALHGTLAVALAWLGPAQAVTADFGAAHVHAIVTHAGPGRSVHLARLSEQPGWVEEYDWSGPAGRVLVYGRATGAAGALEYAVVEAPAGWTLRVAEPGNNRALRSSLLAFAQAVRGAGERGPVLAGSAPLDAAAAAAVSSRDGLRVSVPVGRGERAADLRDLLPKGTAQTHADG